MSSDSPMAEPPAQLIFDDPLSQETSETARRWGWEGADSWGTSEAGDGGPTDLARFLDEKPPHHL